MQILKQIQGLIIVVWDNAAIHKGAPIRNICSRYRRLRLEALPPYAPELNPDEGVWNHAERNLSNGQPSTKKILRREITRILNNLRSLQPNLRSCFYKSDLPLFLP